ncbi:MAG: MBL fold metallo-hydrolase [Robiginitomaculum sp.]
MIHIPFVRNIKFEVGKRHSLSPLVSRVMADNSGPFTYTGTGVFIIGTKELAIIDPGPITPAHKKALNAALKGKSLTHIFLTHHHADHSPMATVLAKKHGCRIYGLSPKDTGSDPDAVELEAGIDKNFAPDIQINHGQMFHGPEWTLEALHTPGHTSNHVCFALHQENTLFSGDHIMGWATSVVIPPDGNMRQYLRSLRDIQKLNFSTIRPTHGAAIQDVVPFIKAYIDHRLARELQILAAVQAGHSNVMDMVHHIYTDIDKRLYPAAALSVLSHLIHLVERDKIKCKGKLTLSGNYTPL